MKQETTETAPHTAASLAEMSNDALNALAAEMRGWKIMRCPIVEMWCDIANGDAMIRPDRWTPATDANQALGLLDWAASQGCYFNIGFGEFNTEVRARISLEKTSVSEREAFLDAAIPGNDARSMVIAFVLAMQEMGRRNDPA